MLLTVPVDGCTMRSRGERIDLRPNPRTIDVYLYAGQPPRRREDNDCAETEVPGVRQCGTRSGPLAGGPACRRARVRAGDRQHLRQGRPTAAIGRPHGVHQRRRPRDTLRRHDQPAGLLRDRLRARGHVRREGHLHQLCRPLDIGRGRRGRPHDRGQLRDARGGPDGRGGRRRGRAADDRDRVDRRRGEGWTRRRCRSGPSTPSRRPSRPSRASSSTRARSTCEAVVPPRSRCTSTASPSPTRRPATSNLEVSLSSLSEFELLSGGFDAEYGNVQSGVINLQTREGGRSSPARSST